MPYRIYALAALRRHNPAIAVLVNLFCGCEYDSALLSQVFHSYLAYLRGILLIRYILVKGNISLDSILLSGIIFASWDWLASRKRGINVTVAPTLGFPERAPWGSREFVPSARVHTGINLENSRPKRADRSLESLAERGRFELPTVCTHSAAVLQTAPLPGSGISPLSGAGGKIASQTYPSRSSSEWYFVPVRVEVRPLPLRHSRFLVVHSFDLVAKGKARQHPVNGRRRVLLGRYIETPKFEGLYNSSRRQQSFLGFHNFHAGFRYSHVIKPWRLGAECRKCCDGSTEPSKFVLEDVCLVVDVVKPLARLIESGPGFLQCSPICRCLLVSHGGSI